MENENGIIVRLNKNEKKTVKIKFYNFKCYNKNFYGSAQQIVCWWFLITNVSSEGEQD